MMQFPQVRPAVRPAVRDALTPDITTPQTVIAGLFAQGQQGFWLPFTDFASLTQDAAGTLPYTALEQPVGRVLDRSGRGNHASQVTSSARGKVRAAVISPPTRPYYLQLDGVDDFYTCGGGGSPTGFYYSDVIRPTSAIYSALIADNTGSGGYLVERTNTGISFIANGGGTIRSVSLPLAVNVQAFVCVFDDGVNLVLKVNDAQTSIARPAVTAGSATMYLGRYPTIAQYFNGQVTEPIYRAGTPPTEYERGVIRAYQMQKAGML